MASPLDEKSGLMEELEKERLLEEMEKLRAEEQESSGERNAVDFLSPDDQSPQAQAARGLTKVGRTAVKTIGEIGSIVDRVNPLGAPMRRAVDKGMDSGFAEGAKEYGRAYLNPMEPSPPLSKIAERLGVPGEEKFPIDTGIIKNPFAKDPKDRTYKTSPAQLVGTLGEQVLDPSTWVPGSVAKVAGKTMTVPVKAAAKAPGWLGEKAASVLARVEPEDFRYYMANQERLSKTDAVPGYEEQIGNVQEAVRTRELWREEVAQEVQNAQKALDEKMAEWKAKADLGSTDIEEARGLMVQLDAQKQRMGEMSRKADEALDNSGLTFEKNHLIALLNKVGLEGTKGAPLIGDAAQNAAFKLKELRDRIAGGAPDDIPAPMLRSILQQIRNDIDFDLRRGEFDGQLNLMRKKVQKSISDVLKNQVPEYSAYMASMSRLADSMENMVPYFGTEKAAISSLQRVRNARNATDQVPTEVLRKFAEETKDPEILRKIQEWERKRKLIAILKDKQNAPQVLAQDQVATLEKARTAQADLNDALEASRRVSLDSAEKILRNQARLRGASVLDRQHLDELGKLTDKDLMTPIKDRGVLDRLYADRTRGARMAAAGGFIGATLPGDPTVNALLMTNLALTADRYSGVMAKSAMDLAAPASRKVRALVKPVVNAVMTSPDLLGKYKPYFEKAVTVHGVRGASMMHHILLNHDPEYRQFLREKFDNGQN